MTFKKTTCAPVVLADDTIAPMPVRFSLHPTQNRHVNPFLSLANPILENALAWVKKGKYQDVKHNPTCVSGSKAGHTQSNTPVDHFWVPELARTEDSGDMSERAPSGSSLLLMGGHMKVSLLLTNSSPLLLFVWVVAAGGTDAGLSKVTV